MTPRLSLLKHTVSQTGLCLPPLQHIMSHYCLDTLTSLKRLFNANTDKCKPTPLRWLTEADRNTSIKPKIKTHTHTPPPCHQPQKNPPQTGGPKRQQHRNRRPPQSYWIQFSAVLGTNLMGAQYRRVHRTFSPQAQTNVTKIFLQKLLDNCRSFLYMSFL